MGLEQEATTDWLQRGWAAHNAGRPQEAETCYRTVLEAHPNYAKAWALLGFLYLDHTRPEQALEPLRRAVSLAPDQPQHHLWLGRALADTGDLANARSYLEHVVTAQPKLPEARFRLGHVCLELGDTAVALKQYQALVALQPQVAKASLFLGYALQALGRWDEALAAYERALALDPKTHDATAGKATIMESRGDRAGALALIRPVIGSDGHNGNVALAYLAASKESSHRADARRYAEETLKTASLSASRRRILHHNLGNAYRSERQYDQAFEQYRMGNEVSRQRFDRASHQRLIDGIINVFSADSLRQMPRSGDSHSQPVFIVGMPRSGTTLVEQIIDSHPDAAGAGELDAVNHLAQMLHAEPGNPRAYPAGAHDLNRYEWQGLADRYLKVLRTSRDGARRITDKMPHNFLHLGFIQQMLPAARVIHCVRDPRDTCLSAYMTAFGGNHPYSNDLTELGFYYQEYVRLMTHWQATLPPLLTVSYEELVADQEGVSRRIIDFCGLEWDDRCLRFHSSGRDVNTASYDQVRRPIYTSSVGAWRHYAHHLGPLLKALEGLPQELLPDPDSGVAPRFPAGG